MIRSSTFGLASLLVLMMFVMLNANGQTTMSPPRRIDAEEAGKIGLLKKQKMENCTIIRRPSTVSFRQCFPILYIVMSFESKSNITYNELQTAQSQQRHNVSLSNFCSSREILKFTKQNRRQFLVNLTVC